MDWAFKDCGLVTKQEMENLAGEAKQSGVDPAIVHWSGATHTYGAGDAPKVDPQKLRPVKNGAAC